MGVIRCDGAGGPFTVVVFPKSASTSIRTALSSFAKPGQYTVNGDGTITKGTFKLLEPFLYGPNAVAYMRNPFKRVASYWADTGRGNGMSLSACALELTPQTSLVKGPLRFGVKVVADDSILWGKRINARKSGVDWAAAFREEPDAVSAVMDIHAHDFDLGITWSTP